MKVDVRAEAWARLQLSGAAPRPLVELLRAFGSPEALLAATPSERRGHVSESIASVLDQRADPDGLRATLDWIGEPDHGLVAWGDPDYPPALMEIGDPPPVLYWQGRRELLGFPAFAIVGSRNATDQGRADAEAFGAALSASGLSIVSGLAYGIDAAAHRGGLQYPASTIAVVGTGLDRVYPAGNRDLARDIGARGLLISEFAIGTPPLRHNFPKRNRLVSGLSRGVLVVEATLSSGSLITARLAAEQGREVFAIPGSIHSPFSKGGHKLIREGAKLVETAKDILDELGVVIDDRPRDGSTRPIDGQDPEAREVIRALGFDPVDIDTLAARSGLSAQVVVAKLTGLELEGRVSAVGGGLWQRICRSRP